MVSVQSPPVSADELQRSGYAQRVVAAADLDAAVEKCVGQLLAVPPGPLAMTRAMMSAIGRTVPPMVAAWGDADHQQWSFTEAEYRQAARAYIEGSVKKD